MTRNKAWAKRLHCLALSFVLSFLLLGTTSAFAAGAAVFSSPAPAAGSAVLAKPWWISVMSDDTAPVISASIKVNGVAAFTQVTNPVGHWVYDEEAEDQYFVVDDATIAKIQSYKTSWAMINGTNTVVATVVSASGISTHTWTFDYVTGTTVTTVTPAPASVLPESPATVSATLTSPYPAFTSSMRIDGVVVPTTYAPTTKTFTHTPATALSPGTHTAVFTASATAGSATRTWSFTVRPPMSTGGECASCHSAYAASHPRVGCDKCHDAAYAPAGKHGGFVPTVAGCMGDDISNGIAECHQFDHSGQMGAGLPGFACGYCHSASYPALPQHTDAATVAKHVSATDCEPCHVTSLIDEHAKYPMASTVKHQCDLCHDPGVRQTVKDAIATGTTACDACHGSAPHGDMQSIHQSNVQTGTVPMHYGRIFQADCTTCHSLSLQVLHKNDCYTCHRSADSRVKTAIASWNGTCIECHATYHPEAGAAHSALYNRATDLCTGNCHGQESNDTNNWRMVEGCVECHPSSIGPDAAQPPFWTTDGGPKVHQRYRKVISGGSWPNYLRPDQPFIVPSGVTTVSVDMYGGAGSQGGMPPLEAPGGLGGRVQAEIPVTPETTLSVRVGEPAVRPHSIWSWSSIRQGWPNGGIGQGASAAPGTDGTNGAGSGGGSSRLFFGAQTLVEAGGGGGGGGGAAGTPGVPGGTPAIGAGGNQTGGTGSYSIPYGGGGGGGWNAGVGGASGKGGGGGTSYVSAGIAIFTQGALMPVGKYDYPVDLFWADVLTPSTTSDAMGTYIGDATITLTASDEGGSNLAFTRYRLDKGLEYTGTSVTVPVSTSPASHTLTFYSVDNAGNVEDPRKVTFTVE